MEFENSKLKIRTKYKQVYEIYKIKIEIHFVNDPHTMVYTLMGKTSPDKDEWVNLGNYFRANEDKLFMHLQNIRRLFESYLMGGYISEYNMIAFEEL